MQVQNTVDWKGFRAFAENLPQSLPGSYSLLNLENGKRYVGVSRDIKNRLLGYVRGAHCQIGSALRLYGMRTFLVEPLLYLIPRSSIEDLFELEAQLIRDFDSVENGYNIQEVSLVGPAGKKFGEIVKDRMQDPEIQRRHRAGIDQFLDGARGTDIFSERTIKMWKDPQYRGNLTRIFSDPIVKKKRSDSLKAAWKRPEVIARQRATTFSPETNARRASSVRQTWSDPLLRAEQSDRQRTFLANPENHARRADQLGVARAKAVQVSTAKITGSIWITDGAKNARVRPDAAIPDGWYPGRARTTRFGPRPKVVVNSGVLA